MEKLRNYLNSFPKSGKIGLIKIGIVKHYGRYSIDKVADWEMIKRVCNIPFSWKSSEMDNVFNTIVQEFAKLNLRLHVEFIIYENSKEVYVSTFQTY